MEAIYKTIGDWRRLENLRILHPCSRFTQCYAMKPSYMITGETTDDKGHKITVHNLVYAENLKLYGKKGPAFDGRK